MYNQSGHENKEHGHTRLLLVKQLLLNNTIFFYDVESPAAKTGLLVNDEILEVNGESVANLSHTEVILSIHKVGYNRFRTRVPILQRSRHHAQIAW